MACEMNSFYCKTFNMKILRSLLFNILFYPGTIFLAFAMLPLLVSSRMTSYAGSFWGWLTCKLLFITGICHVNEGDLHLGDQVIYAVKHQSAWETLVLYWQLQGPVIVLKKELMMIPILGWYFARAGCIAVDRKAGMAAVKQLRRQAMLKSGTGRSMLIFPQGTRVSPSTYAPYQIGVFALYQITNLPVVPVALNSGLFWSRKGYINRAGQITVSYLPPIEPGLSRKEFMARLEQEIETRTNALEEMSRKG